MFLDVLYHCGPSGHPMTAVARGPEKVRTFILSALLPIAMDVSVYTIAAGHVEVAHKRFWDVLGAGEQRGNLSRHVHSLGHFPLRPINRLPTC